MSKFLLIFVLTKTNNKAMKVKLTKDQTELINTLMVEFDKVNQKANEGGVLNVLAIKAVADKKINFDNTNKLLKDKYYELIEKQVKKDYMLLKKDIESLSLNIVILRYNLLVINLSGDKSFGGYSNELGIHYEIKTEINYEYHEEVPIGIQLYVSNIQHAYKNYETQGKFDTIQDLIKDQRVIKTLEHLHYEKLRRGK